MEPHEPQGKRPIVVIVVGLALLFLIIAGAIAYNRYQASQAREKALRESQRQDYALCVIQNANRKATRRAALIQFGTISDVFRFSAGDNPALEKAFERRLGQLEKLVKAQQAIDCKTYVRPDLPPDTGVESTP